MIKYIDPNSSEAKAKYAAMMDLIGHIDGKLSEERKSMRKSPQVEVEMDVARMPDGDADDSEMPFASTEVLGEVAERATDHEQPMDNDFNEGDVHQEAPLDMNQVVHEVTRSEDDPEFDVGNPETADRLAKQMEAGMEEGVKYRPRIPVEKEKGTLYVTKKSFGTTAPMPQQEVRKMKAGRPKRGM